MRGPRQWSTAVNEWNAKVIEEFRANGGVVGGPAAGQPLLLLHSTGARSGLERVTPMVYLARNGRLYVFASKDRADTHPAWFHNVTRNPDVEVEVGTGHFPAVARPLPEEARLRVFTMAAARFPRPAQNATMTNRTIPVIELVRGPSEPSGTGDAGGGPTAGSAQ